MNLGIVIAVSDYGSLNKNLPGCRADGNAIYSILKADNKFDDVLYISKKTSSSDIKPDLIKFISSHKDNQINDVVFYFTGHGDFDGDEFYYLLSDYENKRKKQTCLENTELDNLLKTLNPQNTIKIVDACHSGTPYIKDQEAFDTYLKGTQGEFKKCYFMFSSQTEQYSYQDEKLSFFTKSIAESVQQHSNGAIRYKDVIDYVSDSFSENHNQTPFFIVQADFTESFCSVSDSLRQTLKEILFDDADKNEIDANNNAAQDQKSLLDLVKEDAARYCTKEEAQSYLSSFLSGFKTTPLNKQIIDLYEITHENLSDYSDIPSSSAIGKWLDSNEHEFFAKPYIEEVKVRQRVYKDPTKNLLGLGSALSALRPHDDDEFKFITKTEKHIQGFRSTVDLPIKLLKITIEAKYPNINSASAFIVPLISKTEMRVFFSYNFYENKDWDEKKIKGPAKWLTERVNIKDEESHSTLRSSIIDDFSKFVYTPITEKFNMADPTTQNKPDGE